MDLRERKPVQSNCTLTYDQEDSNYDFKGPIEEAYIASGDTPKVRLTKEKDGGNRQLPKLQKRLVALIDDVGFCTITLQQDFCGLVQRCHGLERSKSWIEPTLVSYVGSSLPGI